MTQSVLRDEWKGRVMKGIIIAHLKSLTKFSGREGREQFWSWVGVVFAVTIALMAALLLNQPPTHTSDFGGIEFETVVVTFAAIVALASAVARRLHDRNLSGSWGLMPIPFLVMSFYFSDILLAANESDALSNTATATNLLYSATLIILAVLLAGRSDAGENRFGPHPDGVN